ncbi:HNH endonuclease [Xanthobacter sp. TB0136]|uniref:HNH endonuclease n=1 Tax=Xanthobacter sp. TB0136 TaxID=3459177 RepID=UPI004039205C
MHLGGEPTLDNCQVLCRACHGEKTFKKDVPTIAKAKRIRDRNIGIKRRKGPPMPGSKASKWKHKMDGSVELR